MWTIFIVQLVGLISPGPDFFYVSRKAMADSRRSGILAAVGITIGVAFWSLAVLFGLAVLNKVFPDFQSILMILGGGYLAYSGIKMVQITKNTQLDKLKQSPKQKSAWQEILGGLMINLSNPKIVVFFSSVLSGYVSNLSNWEDILFVLFILTGSAIVYFSLIAVLLSHKNIQHFYSKNSHYLDNFAGIIFILFGVSLIYEGIMTLIS